MYLPSILLELANTIDEKALRQCRPIYGPDSQHVLNQIQISWLSMLNCCWKWNGSKCIQNKQVTIFKSTSSVDSITFRISDGWSLTTTANSTDNGRTITIVIIFSVFCFKLGKGYVFPVVFNSDHILKNLSTQRCTEHEGLS
ncbi:hypothetical protein L484_000235 [Morus notabilis]|uniref:Uncharacterized protein n=1 Tax=Morus notabilis TaxID=981085 RepID=W9T3B7_9ROSA|nr:hypothetical protein L484_000235 [Morus notabilis]